MARKAGKVILIAMAMILLAVGYSINFTLMLVRVESSREIYLLSFMLGYAVVYLLSWLLVLFVAHKRSSKKLLNIYFVFWVFSAFWLVLFSFMNQPAFFPEPAFFTSLFGLLLFVPLAGFDALGFYVSNGYLYARDMYVAATISIVMFLLGLFVKLLYYRKTKNRNFTPNAKTEYNDSELY